MSKDKVKSKEEQRREKQLNRSLTSAAKAVQSDLNILAFQREDNILKNGEGDYVTVFSIKCIDRSFVNFNSLTSLLCANLAQRFRISSFYQKVNGNLKSLFYLSVFFHEDAYYKVHDTMEKLKKEFFPMLTKYNFQIDQMTLDDILTFWNMNMNSQMVSMDGESILTSRSYQTSFERPKFMKKERIIFEGGNNFCAALKLITVAQDSKNFPFTCFDSFDKIFFAADTWKMTQEDIKTYDRILRSSFYSYKDQTDLEMVNFSVSLVLMDRDHDSLLNNLNTLYKAAEEKGYILVPCFEEEEACFWGIGSFGIMDYFNLQTAALGQITHFYEES